MVADLHEFGGDWTATKLDILGRYLRAYVSILRKRPGLRVAYIDAFAGTGTRHSPVRPDNDRSLFDLDSVRAEASLGLDGSARIALKVEPPFDRYIFVEMDSEKCQRLVKLQSEFPDRTIEIRNGDANEQLKALASKNWSRHRAVLFLDPYGMQVEWATLEAVQRTRAIDAWILFPLGVGVNRLLQREGQIPEGRQRALDRIFGTPTWRGRFYEPKRSIGLFGEEEIQEKIATAAMIAAFYSERLQEIGFTVAPRHTLLRNSKDCPLYMLCFATANERARAAIRIADYLLSGKL